VLATPAARRDAAAAALVKGVRVAHAQLRLLRFVGDLFDAQRERMEIKEQLAIANQSTPRHVRVAQNKVPARVFRRITARPRQHFSPMIQLGVVAVHEFSLAVMNRLAADVDVKARQKVKPKPGLATAPTRRRSAIIPREFEPVSARNGYYFSSCFSQFSQRERPNTSPGNGGREEFHL